MGAEVSGVRYFPINCRHCGGLVRMISMADRQRILDQTTYPDEILTGNGRHADPFSCIGALAGEMNGLRQEIARLRGEPIA